MSERNGGGPGLARPLFNGRRASLVGADGGVAAGADPRAWRDYRGGVAYSPNGRKLAVGSSIAVEIWDTTTWRLERQLFGHTGQVYSVAWSPDGTRVASGSGDLTIKLWEAATGNLLRTLTGHSFGVTSVAWSPDSTRVASGSQDRTIKLWEAGTGTLLRTLTGHTREVLSVAWSPDGARVASGSGDGTVRIWARRPPTLALDPASFTFRGTQGCANPSSQTLRITNIGFGTLTWTATVRTQDGGNWLSVNPMSGTAPSLVTVSVNTSGLAAGAYTGTIRIEAPGAMDSPQTIPVTLTIDPPPRISVTPPSLSFRGVQGGPNPLSQPLSITNGGSGTLTWTATVMTQEGGNWLAINPTSGTAPSTMTVAVNLSGLAAGSYRGKITIASACADNSPQEIPVTLTVEPPPRLGVDPPDFTFRGAPGGPNPPSQTLMIRNLGGGTLTWTASVNTENGGNWLSVTPASGTAPSSVTVAVNTSGLDWGDYPGAITVEAPGTLDTPQTVPVLLRLRRVVEGWEETRVFTGHRSAVRTVAWSPDGSQLASGANDGEIRVWAAESGELVQALAAHTEEVTSVAWSGDGQRLATASMDRTVKIWDTKSWQVVGELRGHTNGVRSVAWSPDGSQLATGSQDLTIKLWSAASYEAMTTLRDHTQGVQTIAWSPDGSVLASGSQDRTIKLWDATSYQLVITLPQVAEEGHTASVESVAWSPDGSQLATSGFEGTIKLWDGASYDLQATLDQRPASVFAVSWSGDGSWLASGSWDGLVRIWDGQSYQRTSVLSGHTGPVNAVDWSATGAGLLSGSSDGTVRLWRPAP
ncbi:MAG: choice-of-anchor D domain-containing protein [Acidobacteria bacterium]|nr:choice-of-anchor D domain-containing protein [Acidobacteriota bacterium]